MYAHHILERLKSVVFLFFSFSWGG